MFEPLYHRKIYLKISFIIFAVAFSSLICYGQEKVDLEIKGTSPIKTVSGGEKLVYTFTVTNLSSETAKDVYLNHSLPREGQFVSAIVSQGNFKTNSPENPIRQPFVLCHFGDIQGYAEATVTIEIKLNDWGDRSANDKNENSRLLALIEKIENRENPKPFVKDENLPVDLAKKSLPLEIMYPNYSCENCNYKEQQFAQYIPLNLLPSKNAPPRVEIITPTEEQIITRNSKKLTKVVFNIKAFDPDGTIEKVTVNTQQFSVSVEYPENKIVIDGEKYSLKEVADNPEKFQKYFGGDAVKVDKDTYTFTVENPKYGLNVIFVEAVDNEKRTGSASVRLTVKGDNSIVFNNPINNSIIKPDTDLIIETVSKLNDGIPTEILLIENSLCCENRPMKQISKTGNSYTHQYLWKKIPKGRYYAQILLTEDSGAYTYSEGVEFKVTEKPKVKITSVKNGQIFNQGDDVPIEIDATDADGTIENVSVSVDDKYERDFSWNQGGYKKSGTISSLRKGTYIIKAKVSDDLEVEVESEPITVIVK